MEIFLASASKSGAQKHKKPQVSLLETAASASYENPSRSML
jgi:hypothetical protein